MKVFLAGCEVVQFLKILPMVGHKYALFSYFHWKKSGQAERKAQRDIFEQYQMQVICDSGLFTLMFGAGKGGSYDLEFMKNYTKQYIQTAKSFGIKKLTIVESDVHKLLGMDAVFELRKYFEDSGLDVIYVWHKEEGQDGLMELARSKKYIALSIPELRILFKGEDERYQTITKQLLREIKTSTNGEIPRIHLLGNTIQETMENTIAYSCDSTSWLSGGRFGTCIDFTGQELKSIRRVSQKYIAWKKVFKQNHEEVYNRLKAEFNNEKNFEYMISILFSALSMKRYQDFLDQRFKWIGKNDPYGN